MRKYTLFSICCLVPLFAAVIACAQAGPRGQFGPGGGFTGPGAYPPPGGTGFGPPPPPSGGPQGFGYGFTGSGAYPPPGGSQGFGYGFTGPSQAVSVAQAQSYGHRTPVIIRGNIVQALGGDLYTFRDSSGEIVLRIGPKEWQYYGSSISPSDTVEISGEFHRKSWWDQPQVHARFMRKI